MNEPVSRELNRLFAPAERLAECQLVEVTYALNVTQKQQLQQLLTNLPNVKQLRSNTSSTQSAYRSDVHRDLPFAGVPTEQPGIRRAHAADEDQDELSGGGSEAARPAFHTEPE